MKRKILIIDGHPDQESFCSALASAYGQGAHQSNFEIERINLRELKFELNLKHGYRQIQELEPDLISAQEKIKWCDHLILVYPLWWGSMPALLKGFLDRCWLPGFAFKYHKTDPFWDRLLKGRSARMIVTSDAPVFFNFIAYYNAPYVTMRKTILGFCGFKPVRQTRIGGVKNLAASKRNAILQQMIKLGEAGN